MPPSDFPAENPRTQTRPFHTLTVVCNVKNAMTLIEKAVEILRKEGYTVIQWFEPDNQSRFEPKVLFEGKEFDLIKVYELFEILDFPILDARRVYCKDPIYDEQDIEIGENWTDPYNELTFAI
ncbi:hypothetical protein BAA08_15635 [Bizionia sp. APA-3]|nr:hypothetical protein BAA08_15635 [Bizionia sp. APA-3]